MSKVLQVSLERLQQEWKDTMVEQAKVREVLKKRLEEAFYQETGIGVGAVLKDREGYYWTVSSVRNPQSNPEVRACKHKKKTGKPSDRDHVVLRHQWKNWEILSQKEELQS